MAGVKLLSNCEGLLKIGIFNLETLTEKHRFNGMMDPLPYQRTSISDDVVYTFHGPVLCELSALSRGPKRKMFCDFDG